MPRSLPGFVLVILLSLLFGALINPGATRANPDLLNSIIIRADSLDRADGDAALAAYVREQSILIGAVVAQLIEDAIGAGDGGDAAAEKENLDFAEKVVRHHLEESGSDIPKRLLETSRRWGTKERAIRRDARSLEEQAVELRSTQEPDALGHAIELYNQARDLYEQIDDKHSVAVNWGSLGVAHWFLGDMEGAREQYTQALVARRLVEDRLLEGKTLNVLGSVNLNLGNFDEAESFYTQAVDLRTKTGDDLATSMTYLGQLYSVVGDPISARDLYERALTVAENSGDVAGTMRALNGVATMYSEMGRLNASNETYRRGIEILRHLDEPSDEIVLRSNLATNLLEMGRYGEALDELSVCERILKEHPDPSKKPRFHSDRGLLYEYIGEFDRARDDYLAYLKLARALENPDFETDALTHLGSLYFSLGAYDRALASAERAIEIGEETGAIATVRHAAIVAGQAALFLGKSRKAQTYYEKALAIDTEGEAAGLVIEDRIAIASS
ncbi:MAG: tetratricopeptide repeat protein, partial [bacterium]|nr:tetratricopeptide repeat protein [bacterium]